VGSLLTEVKQVAVDELTAVIGVDATQWERQPLLDFPKGAHDPELSFAYDGLSFHPAC
jgi:hypothetical protein